MKGLQGGISIAMLATVAKAQLISGAGGVDTGNAAAVPITNGFSSTVNEAHSDDHSADVDAKKKVVEPHGHPSHPDHSGHHWAREDIDGNDTGTEYYHPETNVQSTSVNESHQGDHSVDLDEDIKVVEPAHGRPHPHPHEPSHHKARGTDDLIGGASGIDTGNAAAVPFTNAFSSSVNEAHSDDHSATIHDDKSVVDPEWHRPHHHPGRGEDALIGGAGGVDTGNSAVLPITNELSSSVNEAHADDHSAEVNKDKTVADPDHPRHHHWPREEPDLIGGAHGIDTGNSAAVPITNGFSSAVNEAHADDHSVDLNKDKTVVDTDHHRPHHWPRGEPDLIGGAHGTDTSNSAAVPITNTFSSGVSETHSDDHSADVNKDKTVIHPEEHHPEDHRHHHGIRGNEDLIGGAGGIDTGNTATIPITNGFSSTVNEASTDDHSAKVDKDKTVVAPEHHPDFHHPHHIRGEPSLIGGASGVDTANGAAIPITNGFSSSVNEYSADDHSVDADLKDTLVRPGVHHPHHVRDLIGGAGGIDTGNSVVIPITNAFASSDHEVSSDDHSADVNAKDTLVAPPDHHHPHPHGPRDLISGASGIDTGNSAVLPFTNVFASSDNEYSSDDHSADVSVKDTVVDPASHHHHPHVPRDLIGGASGVDTGNLAILPFTNLASNEVSEEHADDHSADVNVKDTVVDPKPHHHHPHVPRDLIGSASGIDTGNSVVIPFTNVASNEVSEAHSDDHSADVGVKDTVVDPASHHPHPHFPRDLISGAGGVDTGNSAVLPFTNVATSQVSEVSSDDHSVDANVKDTLVKPAPPHHPHPHPHLARDLISGAGGIDTGNSAVLPITNEFSSKVNEVSSDDHSVDANVKGTVINEPPHGHPHEHPHHPRDLISGAGGVDTGNSAVLPFTNEFSSEVNEAHADDHSVDANIKDTLVNEPHRHHHRADDSLISGVSGVDTGNSAVIPITNAFAQDTNEYSSDDHSVSENVDDTVVDPYHGHPDYHAHADPGHFPAPVHGSDQDTEQTEAHGTESQPCSSQIVHEVVHTITRTLNSEPTEGAFADHAQHATPAYNAPAAEETGIAAASTPAYNAPAEETGVAAASTPAYNAPAEETGVAAASTPAYNAPVDSTMTAVESTPVYNGEAEVVEPSGASTFFSPDIAEAHHLVDSPASSAAQPPVALSSNAAAAAPAPTDPFDMDTIASTITIQEASTFHMIPVFVPAPTQTFVEVAASGTPSPRPTGVDAYQPSFRYNLPLASSASLPSSSSVVFTGAGAQVAPAAGLFPFVAGVIALLALVL
ncbi:hypothetical protein BO78DRAFT_375274 [Aspergillus sclerotiicarbonarius CBS 121057]|uniref:GPI anchored protein n=1 Tax=Aspergillus sclerotiicarbonarius (strain CBS 121057 / IBT 28362) TaxID=1448318 RepID=A0A319EI46_ASPSB|nr:hypothetical protein BO78DRAFT_375274 [Aspergillus sclerotiicarbonarius CBS 121057]